MSESSGLQQEWKALQHQYDSFEKCSLLIKLVNVAIVSLLLFHTRLDALIPALNAILWLQDGIWKTFQGRAGNRLMVVERAIAEGQSDKAMQFNTAWAETRPSTPALVAEYLKNALRPTVAFPHLPLMLLALWLSLGVV